MKKAGAWVEVVMPKQEESKVTEMKMDYDGKVYDVRLVDDGTMDTVISIDGKEHRFETEYAAHYRTAEGAMTEEGLKALAKDAIDSGLTEGSLQEAFKQIKELKIKLAEALAERDTAVELANARISQLMENYQKDVSDYTIRATQLIKENQEKSSINVQLAEALEQGAAKVKALEESLQKQRADFEAEFTKLKEANNEAIQQNKGSTEKAISEKTETANKEITKLTEEKQTLVDTHTSEVNKIKSEHQKQMLRKYYETVLKVSGLKLTEKALALLDTCLSEQEIDETIEDIRKTLRTSLLHSEKLTEATIPVSTLNPVESAIHSQVGKVFKGMK